MPTRNPMPRTSFAALCLRAVIVIACALVAPLAAAAPILPPMKLLVVSDGNYPPYLFRGADGRLQGILKDRWDLWARATGVPVDLQGMEWTAAQQKVLDGEADVIDAFTFTDARAAQYDFAHAHSSVEARLFFHSSLGGIHELEGLRGVAVGAKAGSACADWLRGHGVQWLRTYADVRQLIDAAAGGEVRLFCADSPVARYLLVEMGLHDQFHESQPLYTASFDWAVRGGRGDLRNFVQAGFERIPRAQLDAIEGRWIGSPLRSPTVRRYVIGGAIAVVLALAIVVLLVARNRLLQRRAAELSDHDPITGLPNRTGIHTRLSGALLAAATQQRCVALLFVNIDRFKTVNDAFGPRLGDRMLQVVGGRIADCVERFGPAGRMGADEFAVVLDGLGHPAEATSVARKVLDELQRPYDVDGRRVYASASVGIAAYPGDGVHAATLFQNAGIALSQAEMHAAAARRLQFETDLRGALERCEFVLRYQPRYDAASGGVVGFEALLRWDHPGQGMIPPGEFIPILEETGEIAAVGEWVLRSVCEQIRAWELARLQPLPVAVNLSASQFRHRSLDVAIARVIAETGVNAGLLELELTESSLMHDPEDAVRTLRHLESFGVKLSVDDFGTGYSSLAYLKRFPLDALKIDRTFVQDAPNNADDAAITTAIIQLGHALGLRVVAEGVETNEQRDLLIALGCDEMQGFLFARPMPADEAAKLLLPAFAALRCA